MAYSPGGQSVQGQTLEMNGKCAPDNPYLSTFEFVEQVEEISVWFVELQ